MLFVRRFTGLLFTARLVSLFLVCLPRVDAQVKVMTNGDSITFGVGASDPATMSYSAQLARMLGSGFYVQKDGAGGATLLKSGTVSFWNTQGIRITSEMNPDFIYVMLGTNDSKAINWANRDQFVADYLSLIDVYRALPAGPRIFLGLPPPATDSLNDVRGSVVANEVIPRVLEAARQRNLKVIDAHSPFLDPFRSVLPDGIHPNDEGHGLIAKQIYQAIVNGRFLSALPASWQRMDVGGSGFGGGDAVDESGVFQVLGAGLGIGGVADSFRLVSQSVVGDGELTARVLGQRNLDPLTASRPDAFAGVTIRESSGVDARHVSVLATPGSGVSFRWRDVVGASGGSFNVAGVTPPVWVRVRRFGSSFTGFYSLDGIAWTQIGSPLSLAMGATTQVGIAVNSGLIGTLSHARMERVQLNGVASSDSGSVPVGPATATSETSTGAVTVSGGLDPASAGSRTVVGNAYAELFDPARAELRFASDSANRPVLGVFAGTTREAAGFDGLRTMSGPAAQNLFTPGSSQDAGFVGAVRIPASGGAGKALVICLNKNAVEPALGVGYDYGSGRFYASFTQAFNGAPSEIYGPVAPRGATYVVRLQKVGGVVRLRVNGVLAAETNSARPVLLASGEGAPITLGGLRPLNPQFVGQLGKFHLRATTLSDTDAVSLENDIKVWLAGTNTSMTTTPASATTDGVLVAVGGGLDPASAGSRTIVGNAYAELFDPTRAELRFASDSANRPVLGVFAGTTREAAGFDGLRTMSGPSAQTLFTPGVSQDTGFVGAVRIPLEGGVGKALVICLNKNAVEPALGVGYDYGSGRFYVSFTQAFNGAPSEIYGPVAPRGATYVVRLQKVGGVVRLRVNGVLAAETNSARPVLLVSGEGAPITLGGLRPLNPQFVGQLGKFHLRATTLSDPEAVSLENDIKAWLAGMN